MDWVYWLGFVATAALLVFVYNRRLPGRSVIPGVVLGLVVGLVWPFTLWIVIGFWWHWRGGPDPRATAATRAQLQQARGFAEQAEREGMHVSAAYWNSETQRLSAQQDQDPGARVSAGRTARIAATCAAATVATLVVFGLAVDPPPETTPDMAGAEPTHESEAPAMPGTRPAPATTQPPTPTQPAAPVVTPNGTVVDVIDGDTVDVALDGGGTERVRVLGIDTPEMFGGEQCWGREASDFAERTLAGQRVRLDSDPTQDDRDAYDRALRYLVLLDARNYSVLAAEAGAARSYVYETPVLLHPQIVAAQQRAQSADAGLWGAPCYGVTDEPAFEPDPAPMPRTASDGGSGGGVAYYENCGAARAAGAAPLHAGDAGYSSKLDRDGDGVACE